MRRFRQLPAIVSTLAILLFAVSASAVTTTNLNSTTKETLAQTIAGSGVTISNVTFTGNNVQAGTFSGGTASGLGMESGVILSTGDVAGAAGPNDIENTSSDLAGGGDADLNAVSGKTTYDASVLEFDFVPTQSTVSFRFVFASEEYTEFVNSNFNDAFAIFLNGTNLALVPSTSTPITINTINQATNSAYYKDNDPTADTYDIEYDGFTTVIQVTASVTPDTTQHIKFAIADASDRRLDTAVFVQAQSLVAGTVITVSATDPDAAEAGSATGTFTVNRTGDLSSALTVNYTLSGTATNGVDYQTIVSSVTIPASQTSATVVVTPIDDALFDPAETVILTIASGTGYTIGSPSSATVTIADNDTSVTLGATKAPSNFNPAVGEEFNYVITVVNTGTGPATGVTISDPLPSDVQFVSSTPSQGTCSGTATVTCNLGTLNGGASATVTLRVRAIGSGTVTNVASIDADQTTVFGATAVVDVQTVPIPTASEWGLLLLAMSLAVAGAVFIKR